MAARQQSTPTNTGTPTTQGLSSEAMLAQLMQDTQQSLQGIEHRTEAFDSIVREIDSAQKQLDESVKAGDSERRRVQERVLTSTMDRLIKEAATEEIDLAKAVFGINTQLEQLGAEFSKIEQLSDAEKQMIADAQQALKDARDQRASADRKWIFKESAIETADALIKECETGVQTAEVEARSKARNRLMKANMEQALQEFQRLVNKTIEIMEARRISEEQQIKLVGARKDVAYRIKEEAAKALRKIEEDLHAKEGDLQAAEEQLLGLENGTPEHSQQTTKISGLRADVETLRGKQNTALALFQSKERFAADEDVHLSTHQKLAANLMTWITSLKSDTEERVVTFRSRLEAQKALADQEAAKQLDTMGQKIDLNNTEFMAAAGATSDRVRMDKAERHPEQMKRLMEVQAARAKATAEIREREAKLIQYFKDTYGIDPTESSFFHYSGGESGSQPDAPAGA